MTETPQRLVIDTNMLISAALFPKSIPGQVLDKAVRMGLVLFSEATLAELEDVLYREKFDDYLSDEKRTIFIEALKTISHTVAIKESIQVCRDPKDDKFLEVAVNGKATAIVTGDKDLLVLHPFRNILVIQAHEFIENPTNPRGSREKTRASGVGERLEPDENVPKLLTQIEKERNL